MDIYGKYGLTKRIAAAKGIHPLDYIKIESPEFAKEASTIPYEVADLIEKQELVWTLSIESTYGQRRRWNEFLAIRELLQNSLDAEHEAVGYDKIAVKIEENKYGTWIKDRGKGITYKAFILGGEEKDCQMRGAYGEGLKLSLIWFTVLSGAPHRIYFFTRGGIVFSCYYSKLADALVVVFGKSKYSPNGTHVFLWRYFIPKDIYAKLYYKTAGLKTVCKSVYSLAGCTVDMPNLVLSPGGLLYVRDIYVNDISKIAERKPAYFSYNLWWVDLEPNRVMVNSMWSFRREVAHVLGSCPAITEIIEKSLIKKYYGGVQYFRLEDKYFETGIDYSVAIIDEKVAEAVQQLAKKHNITAYSSHGDFDGMSAVAHEGGICVLVPENMFSFFSKIPKASEFVVKHVASMLEGMIPVDEHTFSGYVRGRLQVWRLWKDYVCPVNVKIIKGSRSFYSEKSKTIFIAENDLTWYHDEVFIHELAHAYGIKEYKSAPDLSENFERALAKVAKEIIYFMENNKNRAAVDRCDRGCIYATPKTAEEFFGDIYKKLSTNAISELLYDPVMFIIFVKPATGAEYFFRVCYLQVEKIPVEEAYSKSVKERLRTLKEAWDRYKRGEITRGEARAILEDGGLPAMITEALDGKQLTIYFYDIKEDRYKYLETIE